MKRQFEIGGEYSLNAGCFAPKEDNLFQNLAGFEIASFNTGRSAIRSVLREIEGKRALLPAYICQSVIAAFEAEGCSVEFYNINTDLTIDIDDLKRKCSLGSDVLLIMHYFGYLQDQNDLNNIKTICNHSSITIIEDTTHSLFTKVQTIGDYCIASLRKWFALPDGGIAYSSSKKVKSVPDGEMFFSDIRFAGMFLKGLYLNGLADCNEKYRMLFDKAEGMIDQESEIFPMSGFSMELIKSFDIANAVQKRRGNAAYLHQHIRNPFVKLIYKKFANELCPLFYPLFVQGRDKFRNYLNQNKIYCPVHWPIADKRVLEFDAVRYIADHIISIPIDQRYSISEMEYICRVINDFQEWTS